MQLNKNLISIYPYGDRSAISIRKILIALIAFELVAMLIILLGDEIVWAYFFSIVFTPLFLIAIPLDPVVGLMGMIISTGFDFLGTVAESDDTSTLHLTYYHLIMVMTFFSVLLHLLLKKKLTIPASPLWPPIIVFLLSITISTIYTPDFRSGSIECARIIFMVLTTLIVMITVNRKWRVQLIIWSIILIPLLISILSLYQLLNEGSIFTPIVRKVATEIGIPVYRSTGTFSNPNALGCFLMVGLIPGFALLFQKNQSALIRFLLVISIGFTSVALLISFSRGSWLSTATGILLIVILHRKWSYIAYSLIILSIVLAVLLITEPVVVEAVLDRVGSIFDPSGDKSSSSRLSLIKMGIWMWQDSPLLGVGMGGFAYNAHNYLDPNMPHEFIWLRDAHTIQAKILAEQGIVGFAIAVWLFLKILFFGIKSINVFNDQFLKNAQIGLVALFVGFIVNFTFASDQFNNMFWLSIGLLYVLPIIDKKYSPKSIITGQK